MDLMETTNTEQISLTESAAQAVKDLLTKRELLDEDYALRVFVQGAVLDFNMEWLSITVFCQTIWSWSSTV